MKPNFNIFSQSAALTPPPIPEAVSFQQAYEKALMNAEAAAQAKHKTKEMDLGNIIKTAQAKYAEPYEAAKTKEKQMYADILERFGGNKEMAQIALMNAQANQAGAHANYYNWQRTLPQSPFGAQIYDINNYQQETNRLAAERGKDDPQVQARNFAIEQAKQLQTTTAVPAAVRTQQINSNRANYIRQYLQKVEPEYIGEGSIAAIRRDVLEWKRTKDPALYDKLTTFGNAVKMIPEYAGYQILSQPGAKDTVAARKHQEKAITQGWPETYQLEVNNFPKELQKGVNAKHGMTLEDINQIGKEADIAYKSGSKYEGKNPPSRLQQNLYTAIDPRYTDENLEHTANEEGITVDELLRQLGLK